MQITHTRSSGGKMLGQDPTWIQDNTGVIICIFFTKKPVWNHQENQIDLRHYQIRHIRCILVLLENSLEQTDPRQISPKIPDTKTTTEGIQITGPIYQTLERNTDPYSDVHLHKTALSS